VNLIVINVIKYFLKHVHGNNNRVNEINDHLSLLTKTMEACFGH